MGTAVRQAQELLRFAGAQIRVDGVWGAQTQKAYESASPDVKASIVNMFRAAGKVMPSERRWVPVAFVDELVTRAAKEVSAMDIRDAVRGFIDLEVPRNKAGDSYDANARNGGSRGLMQMQRAAWSDAQRRYPKLPGYDQVYDPYFNILAGVIYAKINAEGMRKRGFPVTARNLYLAHNQGLGFFDGIRTAVSKQSKKVQEMIAQGPDR